MVDDVERELSDRRALVAFAHLEDVRHGVEMLGSHIRRVSRHLVASVAEGWRQKVRSIA